MRAYTHTGVHHTFRGNERRWSRCFEVVGVRGWCIWLEGLPSAIATGSMGRFEWGWAGGAAEGGGRGMGGVWERPKGMPHEAPVWRRLSGAAGLTVE